MKQPKQYDWHTIFDFGKHKGQSVQDVFQNSPSYISWCFQVIDDFCITDEIFEKLPLVITLRENNFIENVSPQKNWLQIYIDKHNGKKELIANQDSRTNDNNYYERESYGQYAGSHAQDIEGLSDDFINDVLDGDPDAYSNID